MTSSNTNKDNKQIRLSSQPYITHTGDTLTPLQTKVLNAFLDGSSILDSGRKAGIKRKNENQLYIATKRILDSEKVRSEIDYLMEKNQQESLATGIEVMDYFTKVMRGEIKDQFGLDAPLNERTKAAQELAKRLIDMPNKSTNDNKETKIKLDWKR